MQIEINRLNDLFHLEAQNAEGRRVQSDGSPSIGGANLGMRPMEMLLSSLGSCSAMDVIHFLKKMRQPLADIRIQVKGKRNPEEVPSLFTHIHIHYKFFGELDPQKAERAIRMSAEKYCSVSRHLEKSVPISWDFSILPAEDL
jgi:putative redox protein